MKKTLTPKESEKPTIQMEEYSNSFFCDTLSVKKKNKDEFRLSKHYITFKKCNNNTIYMI